MRSRHCGCCWRCRRRRRHHHRLVLVLNSLGLQPRSLCLSHDPNDEAVDGTNVLICGPTRRLQPLGGIDKGVACRVLQPCYKSTGPGSSSGQRATHCLRAPWRDATPHSRAPRRPPDPSQRPITAPSPSCPRRRCGRARPALGPPAGPPPGRRRSCTPCHGTPRRSAAATRCRRRPARGSPSGIPP